MTILKTLVWNYAIDGSVLTSAWTEIMSSVGVNVKQVQIFDSSGSILELAVGQSEVRKLLVMPGGSTLLNVTFAKDDRLSLKAIDADATAGYCVINFIG